MVAYATCAGCTTGHHEDHSYWIQKPPDGVMGGFACDCSGPDECAGNGEKLLRSLFGDAVLHPPAAGRGDIDSGGEARRSVAASQAECDIAEVLHTHPAVTWADALDLAARVLTLPTSDPLSRPVRSESGQTPTGTRVTYEGRRGDPVAILAPSDAPDPTPTPTATDESSEPTEETP